MFCSQCGTQMSNDAKFCSNCGAELHQEEVAATIESPIAAPSVLNPSNTYTPLENETSGTATKDEHVEKRIWWIFGGIIALIVIGLVVYSNTLGSDNYKILHAIETQGRDYLKFNPDKAKFSGSSDTTIKIDSGKATVNGWVDAYNGFGVDSKHDYTASLSINTDNNEWSLDDFTIDNSASKN